MISLWYIAKRTCADAFADATRVWKVGTSLLGMLTPAGPPPQGHGSASNQAYKSLDFKLAFPDEGTVST